MNLHLSVQQRSSVDQNLLPRCIHKFSNVSKKYEATETPCQNPAMVMYCMTTKGYLSGMKAEQKSTVGMYSHGDYILFICKKLCKVII